MIKAAILLILVTSSLATFEEDKVSAPPGMHESTMYSGFLNTSVESRKMHYIFVEANATDPKAVPLAIWLNGGPGCSSLMGMLSEVGPYMVDNDYQQGDLLTKNEYAWSNAANMLFLESPSIVGFSTDTDSHYHWTDQETAKDLLEAIKDFLFTKAPQYASFSLHITGESYAGKYIPDVTALILQYNMQQPQQSQIKLKGIMVGNGVMNFEDYSLDKSQVQYMLDHDMISNRIRYIYENACRKDYHGPRCRFSKFEISIFEAYINPYNVFETCKKGMTTQGNRLMEMLKSQHSMRAGGRIMRKQKSLGDIPDCPSDAGGIKYWNLNKHAFNVGNSTKTWQVCSPLNYSMTERGSLQEYRSIMLTGAVRIWLYSGDWDDVVPFTDTQKNVEKLNRPKQGDWSPWNTGGQHAGFFQTYDRLTTITVKGAGHMVPQNQPKASYQMFYNFINGKAVNNQIY